MTYNVFSGTLNPTHSLTLVNVASLPYESWNAENAHEHKFIFQG